MDLIDTAQHRLQSINVPTVVLWSRVATVQSLKTTAKAVRGERSYQLLSPGVHVRWVILETWPQRNERWPQRDGKGYQCGGCGIPPGRKRKAGHTSTKKRGDEGREPLLERGGEVRVRDCKITVKLSEVSEPNRATILHTALRSTRRTSATRASEENVLMQRAVEKKNCGCSTRSWCGVVNLDLFRVANIWFGVKFYRDAYARFPPVGDTLSSWYSVAKQAVKW